MKWFITTLFILFPFFSYSQICNPRNTRGSNQIVKGDLLSVLLKSEKGDTLGYFNNFNCDSVGYAGVINSGKPLILHSGEAIHIEVTGSDSFVGWFTRLGIWLDLNRNDSFESTETISNPEFGPFRYVHSATIAKATFHLPCFSDTGKSILRFRTVSSLYTLTKYNACGSLNAAGNIIDLETDLQDAKINPVNFTQSEDSLWVKRVVFLNSSITNSNCSQKWNFVGVSTSFTSTGMQGIAKWNSAGTYAVKLIVELCGAKDSVTKSIVIYSPSKTPDAKFIADLKTVELNQYATLYDQSTDGAYIFHWEIYSPKAVKYTFGAQNPTIQLNELGEWKVCLQSENGNGTSAKSCVVKYLHCIYPTKYILGKDYQTSADSGSLFDNGTDTGDYKASKTTDYFSVRPCNAVEAKIYLVQLKFHPNTGSIKIYDGPDEASKLLTPVDGLNYSNQNTWRNKVLTAKSGFFYVTFYSGSNYSDSGFQINWKITIDTLKKPGASYTTECDTFYVGNQIQFYGSVKTKAKQINWEYMFPNSPYMGFNRDFAYTFTDTGQQTVCLAAHSCSGSDTFCKTFRIINTIDPVSLSFSADDVQPEVYQKVQITSKSCEASNYEWEIYPTYFYYLQGSSSTSKNIAISFLKDTCYTIKLRAWNNNGGYYNTLTEIVKTDYVCAKKYIIPMVNNFTPAYSDIMFQLKSSVTGDSMEYQRDTSKSYQLFEASDPLKMYCYSDYSLSVKNSGFTDTFKIAAWCDYNRDGQFDTYYEVVINPSKFIGTTLSHSIPLWSFRSGLSKEGITRLRIAIAEKNATITADSINGNGSFTDIKFRISKNPDPPKLVVTFKDTSILKKKNLPNCVNLAIYKDYYASDKYEGDISGQVSITTNLDCSKAGKYYYYFKVCNCSDVCAEETRYITITEDTIKPVFHYSRANYDTISVCAVYAEPTVSASDNEDGDLTDSIVKTGTITNGVPGNYILTYTVKDKNSNTSVLHFYIAVLDKIKPRIMRNGFGIKNNMQIKMELGGSFQDSVYTIDSCMAAPVLVITPGTNGPVNPNKTGTYPITYSCKDLSGNIAIENNYIIEYLVLDLISPVITLNTADTICHQINTPYSSKQITVTDNYDDSSKISITKNGTVNANLGGYYSETYTATDASGNKSSKTRVVKVADCLGAVKEMENKIAIYPNPADQYLRLKLNQNIPIKELQLQQMDGKFIRIIKCDGNCENMQIPVSELSNGCYLLVTKSGNTQLVTQFMVMHP
ncbi:MAG: DUF5011 domain-containing protein [Bacteroidetes bacterium]|nr:DUF5011 domain-containing protein [Bacteroidota bacterium]